MLGLILTVNQVFLGGGNNDIDNQIKQLEEYKRRLQILEIPNNSLWNTIDNEISSLDDRKRNLIMKDSEYLEIYSSIQMMVHNELLNLVKVKIESSEVGRKLLEKQLESLRKIRKRIDENDKKDMDLFNRFKEFSKDNPNVTYEQFINKEKDDSSRNNS